MFRKVRRYWYNLTHPVIGEVWQLHRVTNEHSKSEVHRPYEITPHRLESLICEYQSKGYVFVSMEEVREEMTGEKRLGQKFVAVTLDDGYADNYEIAYPMLKKYNVPFCIYICENMILGKKQEDSIEHYRFLTTDQIKDLSKEPLCTLGSHTQNHIHLSSLTSEEQYEEIRHCKEWVEKLIGKSVLDFAYPYGDYNHNTIEVVRKVGIQSAVAAWGGYVRKNTSEKILKIPRLLITETGKR